MKFTAVSLLLFLPLSLTAQIHLNGAAVQLSDSCYRLTGETNNSAGSIWSEDKIDLNESFDVIVKVFLGCKDGDGADGMVFGFQPISTSVGGVGGGIGFAGIVPSLGIEMDTYQNININDPGYDHMCIFRDGDLDHNNTSHQLTQVVQASSASGNIEDCKSHDFRVSWNVNTHRLDVYFDCQLRLSYTGNIVDDIFMGDPNVFWGFTAGTGSLNNRHEVCLEYTTFLNALPDVYLCPGDTAQMHAIGGSSYHWSPAVGLSDTAVYNPYVFPTQNTAYSVIITDYCGREYYDSVNVYVDGNRTSVQIGNDTMICQGQSVLLDATTPDVVYLWSDGSTSPTLLVSESGDYRITVHNGNCYASDTLSVTVVQPPDVVDLGKDTTLCLDARLLLDASLPATSYLWQDGSTQPFYEVQMPGGLYSVSLSNICGVSTDDIRVSYENCHNYYIPNTFSPNDDGINDLFTIYSDGDITEVILFSVYDRWGNWLYSTKNQSPDSFFWGWDGSFHGKKMDSGVYVWYALIRFKDGSRIQKSGDVTLMR